MMIDIMNPELHRDGVVYALKSDLPREINYQIDCDRQEVLEFMDYDFTPEGDIRTYIMEGDEERTVYMDARDVDITEDDLKDFIVYNHEHAYTI